MLGLLRAAIRLVVTPGAEVVAELPGLGVGALSTAAFKLAEPVTLAQLIAGAEREDRALRCGENMPGLLPF
jgi:hypothetical protein